MSQNTLVLKEAQNNLLSVASIANELAQDIEHIYHRPMGELSNLTTHKEDPTVVKLIASLHGGDLLLIATRDDAIKKAFCHKVIQYVALKLRQPITLFGMPEPFWRFTRDMVDFMADIPSDAAIYDGQLDEAALKRLSSTLAQLSSTHIDMNPGRMIRIDDLCLSAKHQVEDYGAGLILVNSMDQIVDAKYTVADKQRILIRLKQLAVELDAPVVVLSKLDPTKVTHPSTLAHFELSEVTELSKSTDRVLLLSGVNDKLTLERPKIPVNR